jgi:protein-glutamine gamma-glutamyltransferase
VEKADQVLNFFRDNGFIYTLEPPRLGRHPVDDFIFSSRRGYCEHYASAFAFMMRAINVPARVVGGYLGGEINPYANYLIVRQSDAHAWVEIWDPENGWMRIDPTAAVAPDRISEGMRSVLSAGGAAGFFERLGGLSSFFHQARLGWDAINTGWQAFFEGYSHEVQRALLEKIGIRSGALAASFKAMLLMVALAGMIIGGYAWFFLRPPRQKPDTVQKYYARYCEKLARAGFARKPDQGPIDYMQLVLKNRPDLQKQIAPITDLYVRLRYRDQAAAEDLTAFVEKVRKFDPALKR